tara:strand:+ start:592 stop:1233 length:642 start_codon:yes stop_codon:yes gene_type:complete
MAGVGVEPGSYFNGWKIFESGDAIGERGIPWIIPYFDGVSSISRVVRVFPNYLIFKPAMWLTGILLIRYWISNKKLIEDLGIIDKDIKKIIYFGISSAIFLIIHSIFLGVKFDLSIYKLFRRLVLILFIIFEVTAQFYLIKIFFKNKEKIKELINTKILLLKKVLVYTLILVAVIILPFLPFSNLKILKHILEWNYFLGVITFYLLTYFLWKR